MKTPSKNPIDFLRKEMRTKAMRAPLWLVVFGLALSLFVAWLLHRQLLATPSPATLAIWMCALVLTLGLSFLLLRRNRKSITSVAHDWDERLSTKNRLEAAAELSGSHSPLAEAQRRETATSIGAIQTRRASSLWVPAAIAVLLLITNSWLGTIWLLGSTKPLSQVAPPAPPEAPPTASIQWKTPKAETKATKIEELPLVAEIQSSAGIKDLELEIAVNGLPRKSIAIPQPALSEAGTHEVQISMYLDELEVEPLDIVSYHLKADRIAKTTLPSTTSDLQFVEIRPFRTDAIEMPGMPGELLPDFILELKVAQLSLMKQNFVLSNSELKRGDQVWSNENQRVGTEQKDAAAKAKEGLAFLIADGAAAEVIDAITQAETTMQSASSLILAISNPEATVDQGKALGHITSAIKNLMKVIPKDSEGKPPKVTDPFEDGQEFKLPERESTAAGALERAANDQEDLLAKLNEEESKTPSQAPSENSGKEAAPASDGKTPGEGKGEGKGEGEGSGQGKGKGEGKSGSGLAQKQEDIAKILEALSKDSELTDDIKASIDQALAAAKDSAKQLKADDMTAAKEPATLAMANLNKALDTLKESSAQSADAALEKARRQMNETAKTLNVDEIDMKKAAAEAASEVAAVREDLQDQAKQEQALGDAAAASRLAEIVAAFQENKVIHSLEKLAGGEASDPAEASDKIEALARQMAATQLTLAEDREALENAVAALKRAVTNLEHLETATPGSDGERASMQSELLEDIEAAAQMSAVGARLPASQAGAEAVLEVLGPVRYGASGSRSIALPQKIRELSQTINALVNLLGSELTELRRAEIIAGFRPEESPAVYRQSVADYFEQLSRDYPQSAPSKNP